MSVQNYQLEKLIEADVEWAENRIPVGCQVCGQIFLVRNTRIGQWCPNCAKGSLAAQPVRAGYKTPELLVGFNPRINLPISLENFLKEVWLKPDELNTKNLSQRLVPLYWPMYLVDSQVIGGWEAEIGYNYQVQSSQEIYQDGRWVTRKVIENRQRWENRLGQIRRKYHNVCVPAITGHSNLLKLLGDTSLEQAVAATRGSFDDVDLRMPDMLPGEVWYQAETLIGRVAENECKTASRADFIRDFRLRANYPDPNWTLILLPMYVTYYRDDAGEPQLILINGQTGKFGGVRLSSQRKGWKVAGIMAAIAGIALIIGVIGILLGAIFPPAAILGAILAGIGILIFLAAVAPVAWPWQWNRKQLAEKITTTPAGGKK